MGGKYLAAAWPFAAFVPVLALRRLPARVRLPVAAGGALALVALGLAAGLTWYPAGARAPSAVLAHAGAAVLDDTRRGELPRLAMLLPPGTPVLAADQRRLASPALWREAPGSPLVYVSVTDKPNSALEQERVLAAARTRWRVARPPAELEQATRVFVLRSRRLSLSRTAGTRAAGRARPCPTGCCAGPPGTCG
jgi:hypothetical protein